LGRGEIVSNAYACIPRFKIEADTASIRVALTVRLCCELLQVRRQRQRCGRSGVHDSSAGLCVGRLLAEGDGAAAARGNDYGGAVRVGLRVSGSVGTAVGYGNVEQKLGLSMEH
jgi:hypothetical protein